MLDQIKAWDTELFLWLNGLHADWLDPIMFVMTKPIAWLPFYLVILYFLFKDYRKEGWYILTGIIVTIVLADGITTRFMKPYFARFRPTHEPALQKLVHIVNGYEGGTYGFASGHAANTFGIAILLFLVLRSRHKWASVVFVWAAMMTYTRIYLGVHYPGDIIVGGIVGSLCGLAGYWVLTKMSAKWPRGEKI